MEKNRTCPESHSYFSETGSSWQGYRPTSQHLASQRPRNQPVGGEHCQAAREPGRARARKGTGSGEKRGTYQFLLESLFEFQHPLLHLLYGLRQTPPPAKSHLLHAHSTIFKVPRTTEQPATPLGPYTPVIRHCPSPEGLVLSHLCASRSGPSSLLLAALHAHALQAPQGPLKPSHTLCGALVPQGCPGLPRGSALRTASGACVWKHLCTVDLSFRMRFTCYDPSPLLRKYHFQCLFGTV